MRVSTMVLQTLVGTMDGKRARDKPEPLERTPAAFLDRARSGLGQTWSPVAPQDHTPTLPAFTARNNPPHSYLASPCGDLKGTESIDWGGSIQAIQRNFYEKLTVIKVVPD